MKTRSIILGLCVLFGSATATFSATNVTHTARPTSIKVRVVKETSFFHRALSVTPVTADERVPDIFQVRSGKGASITGVGGKLSIGSIHIGDVINIRGRWIGDRFIADKITLSGGGLCDLGRDYHAIQGNIISVDYNAQRFQVHTSRGERSIYAERARIWRNGDVCGFDKLKPGDRVAIKGNVSGPAVDAERIDVCQG
jgi:hypothetical protein